jgi:putative ABC transport system permease protein
MFPGLLREAWVSIGSHRLRTFLAMLGIIIGVGSVVLMMSIGAGSRRVVEDAINSLGSNILMVIPGGGRSDKGQPYVAPAKFEIRDANTIAQLPSVQAAAPSSFPRSFPVTAGKFNGDTQVTATTPDFFAIREWDFAEGTSFTGDDLRTDTRVAVLGATTADKVFQNEGALGRSLTINGIPFQVIGVLQPKGQGIDGRDQDDAIFVPITTGDSHLWGQNAFTGIVQVIYVKADSADTLDEATENIRSYLRQRFKLPETAADNFAIRNLASIMQVATDTSNAFSMLLGAIASISLLVGAIGIMNIMLVNITERTREIGIRKAIGATKRQILTQFLLEAVVISCVGSFIGLVIGVGMGLGLQRWASITVEFDATTALLALGVAIVIGIGSGLYPAYKAAGMQPIDALRAVGT